MLGKEEILGKYKGCVRQMHFKAYIKYRFLVANQTSNETIKILWPWLFGNIFLLSTFLTIAKVFVSSSKDLSSIGQKFNNQNSKLYKVCTRNDELRLFPQFNGFIFSSQS